jgi:hypothetical protein
VLWHYFSRTCDTFSSSCAGGVAPNPVKDSTVQAALYCATSFVVEALGNLFQPCLQNLIGGHVRSRLERQFSPIDYQASARIAESSRKSYPPRHFQLPRERCDRSSYVVPQLCPRKSRILRRNTFDVAADPAANEDIMLALRTMSSLGNRQGMTSTGEGYVPLLPFCARRLCVCNENPIPTLERRPC